MLDTNIDTQAVLIKERADLIKSKEIKAIYCKLFEDSLEGYEVYKRDNKFEMVIWNLVREVIKDYDLEEFNWSLLCELQNIDICKHIEKLKGTQSNQDNLIDKMINFFKNGKAAIGWLKYEDIINQMYIELSNERELYKYDNICEIKKYREFIVEKNKVNLKRALEVGTDSEFFLKIITNYPIGSKYDNLISINYYLEKSNRYQDININCNIDNNLIKECIKEFYKELIRNNVDVNIEAFRIFSYYLGECSKDKWIRSYKDFDILLLRGLYKKLNNIEEKFGFRNLNKNHVNYSVQFYRFLQIKYKIDYGKSLFDEITNKILLNKNIGKILSGDYDVLYFNRLEEVPVSDKFCVIPNDYITRSADSRNGNFLYISLFELAYIYRKDYKEFLWYETGSDIKSKINVSTYVFEFLNDLVEFKKLNANVIGIDSEISIIPDEFLYEYRLEKEIEYDNLGGLKSVLKAVRKYLKYYKKKYKISDNSMDILNLTGLEKSNGGKPITKNDKNVILKGFIELEGVEKYGKLFTIIFEIFLISNLRIGEILNLNINCLNTEKTHIRCYTKKSKGKMIEKPVSPRVVRLIEQAIEFTNSYREKGFYDDYIFIHPFSRSVGKVNKRVNFNKHFEKVIKYVYDDLEIKDYHPYCIRHTYMNEVCEEARNNDLPVKMVESITGDSRKTIRRYYEKRDSMEPMAKRMFGIKFANVDIKGTILKCDDKKYKQVRNDLGGCTKEKCMLDSGECLRCNYFRTFINRIPRFEREILECEKIISETKNELTKKEMVSYKELLNLYLQGLYKERLKNGGNKN